MFEFGERHPIAFEIVLIVISFFAAALFSAAGNVLDLHPDLGTSAGLDLLCCPSGPVCSIACSGSCLCDCDNCRTI